jgi:hypothetical protein
MALIYKAPKHHRNLGYEGGATMWVLSLIQSTNAPPCTKTFCPELVATNTTLV